MMNGDEEETSNEQSESSVDGPINHKLIPDFKDGHHVFLNCSASGVEHALGRSQMEDLIDKLHEHGYYQFTRRCHETNTVKDMFYAHPTSVKLLRAFPNVLKINCTYKANRYILPLLEIVGVTSTNMKFSGGCAYLEHEREDNYTWLLTVVKGLIGEKTLPTVIVTDREVALMNAIETTFPTSYHLLCRQNINRNIAVNCKKMFRDNEDLDSFLAAWNMVVLADSESQYAELLQRFKDDYSTNPTPVNYVINNWIVPYKERFVNCWTNNVMHFDNTTTCRGGVTYVKFKRILGSNTGNLEAWWEKMYGDFVVSFTEINASFTKSLLVIQHQHNTPIFQFIRGMISVSAWDKVLEEMKIVGKDGAIDPLLCGCVMRTKCGLPCAHEIDEHVRTSTPLSLDRVDKFWKKLSMESVEGVEVDVRCDLSSRWFETVSVVNNKFCNADVPTKLLMLKKLREVINGSTSSMVEPEVQTRTRGRPKNTKSNYVTSTKRDNSVFEYADSYNNNCSGSHECDSSDSHAMFNTRSQKQKVVCRSPPIEYIDQIPPAFRAYVLRIEDVIPDGHCGFRAIAGLLFGNEESWQAIRTDLLHEVRSNPEFWDKCFLEHGQRAKIENALECYELYAPSQHQFVLHDIGHVIATVYKVILVTLDGRYPTTFLPLTSTVPNDPKCICIAAVKLGEVKETNHFIQVFLSPGHPFPPISLQWKDNRNDLAVGWEDVIMHR